MDVKPPVSARVTTASFRLPKTRFWKAWKARLPGEAAAGRLCHGRHASHASHAVVLFSLLKFVTRRASCRATRDINGMSDLVERGYDGFLLNGRMLHGFIVFKLLEVRLKTKEFCFALLFS